MPKPRKPNKPNCETPAEDDVHCFATDHVLSAIALILRYAKLNPDDRALVLDLQNHAETQPSVVGLTPRQLAWFESLIHRAEEEHAELFEPTRGELMLMIASDTRLAKEARVIALLLLSAPERCPSPVELAAETLLMVEEVHANIRILEAVGHVLFDAGQCTFRHRSNTSDNMLDMTFPSETTIH